MVALELFNLSGDCVEGGTERTQFQEHFTLCCEVPDEESRVSDLVKLFCGGVEQVVMETVQQAVAHVVWYYYQIASGEGASVDLGGIHPHLSRS